MVDGREVKMFGHRLFLALFIADAMACSILTPWMGWMMRIRFLEAGLTLGFWEWTSILLWGSYGPLTFCIAVNMAVRTWNGPRR
jgi:hypothetical protein